MLEQIINWIDSMSTMERFFFFYFGILLFIWLWKSESSKSDKSSFNLFKPHPKYELAVNKKAFIYEVVRWGMLNLPYEGADQKRKSVNIEISNYPHKKLLGTYSSFQNKIKVYVNNHAGIDELIDTILHEVVHQKQKSFYKKNFEKRYSKLLEEKTYAKHPMEIEAVQMATAYTPSCKKYLIEQAKLRIQQ